MTLTNQKRGNTLENENPGPTTKSGTAVHLHDAESQQSTKGTGSSRSREEDRHAKTALMTLIPHCNAAQKSASTLRKTKRKTH